MITDMMYSDERINVPGVMSDANWTYRIPVTVEELRNSEDWEWMRHMIKNVLKVTGRSIGELETT